MDRQVPTPLLGDDITQQVLHLSGGSRRLLGIVGPPGSGKSTLAGALVDALGPRAQAVPMDGFHLAQCELHRLGRTGRKGAPDTFDAAGYAHLLRRLKQQSPHETVYAPDFRREIEEPVAGAIAIHPQTPLLVTEGNYLLLEDDLAWAPVADLLDEVWYLEVDPALRRQRLCERHMHFGRTREQALSWIEATDEPNARRIQIFAHLATRQVLWEERAGRFVFRQPGNSR